jgi:hypothetical protein
MVIKETPAFVDDDIEYATRYQEAELRVLYEGKIASRRASHGHKTAAPDMQ